MKSLFGSAALAALMIAAAPASAQSYYDRNPTPAERAQTDALNTKADADAHAAADEATAPPPPAPPAPVDPDYRAAKAAADHANATYYAQRAEYQEDRAGYRERWDGFANADDLRDIRLMPDDHLIGRRVLGRDGARIGRVRDLDRNGLGRVSRVRVMTPSGRATWVDPRDLRYDPADRAVYTELSRGQIDMMIRDRDTAIHS